MDTLTHTMLGACFGEIIAGKQLGKKAMLIGAVANNFPDVDVVSALFVSPAANLLAHRGITHSILACATLSLLFSWLLPRIIKMQNMSFSRLLLLIGSGLFLHILMDACTSYGTGWFEPFDHTRVSFNTLFIIDPFFLIPILTGAVLLLVQRKTSGKRATTAATALVLSAFYLFVTFIIKISMNTIVKNDLAAQNIPLNNYMVAPTPLNNLLWNVVTENDTICYVAYYSVFDKQKKHNYVKFDKGARLLEHYKNDREVQRLSVFSKNFYRVQGGDTSLIFSDLRFGQIGGWYDTTAPFVFTFDIIKKNNAAYIQQGRMKAIEGKPLNELVKRIYGN